GAGALGSSALAVLGALHPDVEVIAVARWASQRALAADLGAALTSNDEADVVVEEVAAWSGGVLHHPWEGLPFAHPGGIDVVYDTIGSPESVEAGIRVLTARGTLVQLGVSSPGRFEWTPWYFKELRLVGSNAFGMETVEGQRAHAMEHYLDLVRAGRVDLSAMLTHTFRLDDWRDAFDALASQQTSGAIKVAFDYRD
ncbi:MAG: zinc-binding dehydrogenase, partial [Acidimicrobiia bacterium]|nr:zinc-binding dehydrogenase [Acidimicrobiia bacterium]